MEAPGSRGSFVRQGDQILLFSGEGRVSDIGNKSAWGVADAQERAALELQHVEPPSHLLSYQENITGTEPKLIHRDRTSMAMSESRHSAAASVSVAEAMQIDLFGSQPLPSWADRPYLSKHFLSLGHNLARSSNSSNSSNSGSNGNNGNNGNGGNVDGGVEGSMDSAVPGNNNKWGVTTEAENRLFPHSKGDTSSSSGGGSSSDIDNMDKKDKRDKIAIPLGQMPALLQEACLVRETLLAFSGVEGQYVRATSTEPDEEGEDSIAGTLGKPSLTSLNNLKNLKNLRFVAHAEDVRSAGVGIMPKSGIPHVQQGVGVDRSLLAQTQQVLPLAGHGACVREFVRLQSRQACGLVSHALAAAVRGLLREFDVLVAQLETEFKGGSLSLQRLAFLIQPSAKVLKLLALVAHRLWDKTGGALLDALHLLQMEQGDVKARQLVLHLFKTAAKPFLHAVSRWIFRGELNDPYKEFMVQEDQSVSKQALSDDFNSSYVNTFYTLMCMGLCFMLQTMEVDSSVLLLSCSITTGALGSPSLLSS